MFSASATHATPSQLHSRKFVMPQGTTSPHGSVSKLQPCNRTLLEDTSLWISAKSSTRNTSLTQPRRQSKLTILLQSSGLCERKYEDSKKQKINTKTVHEEESYLQSTCQIFLRALCSTEVFLNIGARSAEEQLLERGFGWQCAPFSAQVVSASNGVCALNTTEASPSIRSDDRTR